MGDRMAALRPRLRPEPEGRALLGLSGGGDSVALLYLLLPLRDAGKPLLACSQSPTACAVNSFARFVRVVTSAKKPFG